MLIASWAGRVPMLNYALQRERPLKPLGNRMAGHSKWANIKHRKGRSGVFANALNVHSRR